MLVVTAVGTAAALGLAGPLVAALAKTEGQPVVQTSETVKANLDASGKLDVARLFSQIQASGSGTVSLQDPTSTKGLRNLDGWGAPSTSNGKASYDFRVDGKKSFRTVATFTKDLPVSVRVTYALNGKQVKPGDLKGKSGDLKVTYRVKNTTAAPTQISYPDGSGKTVTESIDLVTPLVGQLALDLPKGFTDVSSTGNRADQAGDGHGGRLVSWTMVLFAPIGRVEQNFGFTARTSGSAFPAANVQLVPISPQNHQELKFGQDGFATGAKTGRDLTAGTTKIDDNLLKLRDGAAKLLDGLTKLQDGASQLNAGLETGVPTAIDGGNKLAAGADTAADGAGKVAAGAKKIAAGNRDLSVGLGALATGAGQLKTGANALSTGASALSLGFQDPNSDGDLIDGSQALAGALGLISGGLQSLNDNSTGLPAAKGGAAKLRAAVDTLIIPAIGTTAGPCVATDPARQTLVGCLQQVIAGVTQLGTSHSQVPAQAGLPSIRDGVTALQKGLNGDPAGSTQATQLGVKGGVGAVQSGLQAAVATTGQAFPSGSIERLAAGILTSGDCGPLCVARVNLLILGTPVEPPVPPFPAGTQSLKKTTTDANNALLGVLAGLGVPTSTSPTNLNGGLNLVGGGLDSAVSQVTGQLLPGVTGVRNGLLTLRGGLTNADANSGTSSPACNSAVATGAAGYCGLTEGLAQLVGGLTTAIGGIGQLAPGASAANVGAGDLAAGIAQAGDGATQLAAGASQLSGGLDQVAVKVPAAVTGAKALAKGSSDLSTGSGTLAAALRTQLAPGAHQLATGLEGLNAAKDGSAQIAEGLITAKGGNQQIVTGAGQLSDEGTAKLIDAGDAAAKSYGKEYATMQALNKKGAANAMPYGAPAGAVDNRGAYDLTIAGVGSASGAGSAGRGLAGLGILALGAFAATALRGRFA